MRKYREYDCQLLTPWVSPIPVTSSLALPKGSGLRTFFSIAMLRAIEVGRGARDGERASQNY